MNGEVNRIGDVYEYLAARHRSIIPVVLYPGEKWQIGESHDSFASIRKYDRDYHRIYGNPDLTHTEKRRLHEIEEAAHGFRKQIVDQVGRSVLLYLILLKPLKIYLTDYQQSFRFCFLKGLQKAQTAFEENDISMSSDALLYCFRFLWGFNTLHVNGRFEIPSHGDFNNFRQYERVASMLNNGARFFDLCAHDVKAIGRSALNSLWR
jgi:hypothetical protein